MNAQAELEPGWLVRDVARATLNLAQRDVDQCQRIVARQKQQLANAQRDLNLSTLRLIEARTQVESSA